MPTLLAYPVFAVSLGTLGTVTVTVGTIVQIGLVAGSIVYSQQQAKKAQAAARSAMMRAMGMTITSREPAAFRRVIYGRARAGGTIVFMHTTGGDNKFLHMVIALAGHEVEEIGSVYFDDVEVPLEADGTVLSGKFSGRVRVKKHLGSTGQNADPDLISEVSEKWTSNHRLRGIAYLYVRLSYNAETFSGLPNITAIVKGKKLYDPRNGSTAWSDNPALCLRDYLTDSDYGIGAAPDEIDESSFIAKANLCDESVELSGGSEKRYTCNGGIERSTSPASVLENLVGSFAGALIYTGGFWSLAGGAYETPVETFSWNDLRGPIAFQTADSLRDTCNGVKGTYVSEKNRWQPADYPPVKNATYLAQDGGQAIWRELELPFTTSATTAKRLAKIELERARQDITVKLPLKLVGLRVRAGDVVRLTFDRYGWTNKPFEVMSWRFVAEDGLGENTAPALGVDLELRETASGIWSGGGETTVDLAPDTDLPDWRSVGAPRNLAVASTATSLADGGTVASITVTWDTPLDAFVTSGGRIEAEYKLTSSSDWLPAGSVRGDQTRLVIAPVSMGLAYHVRLRSRNSNGARGDWVVSASIVAAGDVTAPAVPTSFSVTALYRGARVRWVNPTDADLAFVEVFEGASASAPNSSSNAYARVYGTDFIRQGLLIAETRWYWVRAVDASGNKSAWVGGLSATALAIDLGDTVGQITSTQITDSSITTPKLAANSITADKVGSNQIITNQANIGNAVVGTGQIRNLEVTTLKLADQAVTIPVSAYTSADQNVAGIDGWTIVQTATIATTGAPLMVIAGAHVTDASMESQSGPVLTPVSWRIRRGSTTIFESTPYSPYTSSGADPVSHFSIPPPFHAAISDSSAAANRTYTLQVRLNRTSWTASIGNAALLLLETKK